MEVAEIGDVFISRAHLLKNWLLQELARLALTTGARLWLVFQAAALRQSHLDFLGNWPVSELGFEQFEELWSQRAPGGKTERCRAPAPRRPPEVPIDDFPTWRASCRALLSREDFDRIDREFLAAFERTAGHLGSGEEPGEHEICEFCKELIAECDHISEVITRIRGAQVAAFHAGFLMKVNLDLLTPAALSRVRLDDAAIEQLSGYSSPRFVAAAVLLAASAASLEEIIAMNLADLAENSRCASVGGRSYELADGAAMIVEALVRERLSQGALPADPFFVYVPGTGRRYGEVRRATTRGVLRNLKNIERETGLLITSHVTRDGQRDAVSWARRRGLSLQKL